MTQDAEIQLDRKTRALRSNDRWAIQRLMPDGSWDATAFWQGGRRTLLQWCEENDVHPTREAEAVLALLPESTGFRERQ